MVIIKLKGGLGNQMFQYAAAKALSLHIETDLLLDVSYIELSKEFNDFTYRDYQLGFFDIQDPVIGREHLEQMLYGKTFMEKLSYRLGIHNKVQFYQEQTFLFDTNFFEVPSPVLLEGYFQSEKYFERYEKEIQSCFSFEHLLFKVPGELLKNITNRESVSIHFRRGDYISDPNANKVHGVCSMEYYTTAITQIKKQISSPFFFVFSDEIDWVKENFDFTNVPHLFVNYDRHHDYEDLLLMSKCKHNIIANSSFSWWAAWLNNNPEKIVICPEHWFSDNDKKTNDLLPSTWLKL